MKSFFILGLVLLACSVYCEACDVEARKLCMLPLIVSLKDDSDISCDAMITLKDCLVELAEKCGEDEEKDKYMVDSMVDEIQGKIDNLCEDDEYEEYDDDDDDDDDDDEEDAEGILECVGENMAVAATTCGEAVADEMRDIQSDDEQDKRCIAFIKAAECASNQVADKCHEGIAEYLLNGMIVGLKTSPVGKMVESPRCTAAISEAEAIAATQLKK